MTNLREILETLGYSVRDSGNEFRARPIYRDSNNSNSLKINKNDGSFIDFSARLRGNFSELVKLTLGLSTTSEAERWLANHDYIKEHTVTKRTGHIQMQKTYPKEDLVKLLPHHDYWLERKISLNTLKIFQGGLCTAGKMYQRYVFPIFDPTGDIIGYSGRVIKKEITDKDIKWKHVGSKRSFVYPLLFNRLEILTKQEIILVESIGDLLALWESGIKNTLCLFGVDLSPALLSTIIGLSPKKIIVALNNDGEGNGFVGQNSSKSVKESLTQFFDEDQIVVAVPETHKDFGEILEKQDKSGLIGWYKHAQNLGTI